MELTMKTKIFVFSICLCLFLGSTVFTQTHASVSLESQIYYILEQAELRGLCPPLSGSRPYTQNTIITIIDDILYESGGMLNDTEYEVLQQYFDQYSNIKTGIDLQKGAYRNEVTIGNDIPLTFNLGTSLHIEGSAGFYDSFFGNYLGAENWLGLSFNGDIGGNVTWAFNGEVGLIKVPREKLGKYNTYYEGFPKEGETDSQYANREIDVYSQPLAHFPYSYKKRWDGSVHYLSDVNGFNSWPEVMSIGYNVLPEITSSLLDNKLIIRIGRISHEWGSTPYGSSLALNQMSRPFAAVEGEFNPASWLSFSSMTGFLEFFNSEGEKESGMTFQNAYSVTMVQLRYKNYLFLDLGETVVWPKRFELGYLFPLMSNIIYKGFIGDFDNLGVFFNIKAQYPGIGNIWFSMFIDEVRPGSNMSELDRNMFAWQTGANFSLPVLSFSSIKFSYTKVNPYCYTHNRNYNPWYRENLRMETSYTNNGVSLGYYIPPNSDEFLVRFQTMPGKDIQTHLQFQLIRHGADFGTSAVDGSNLLSELDPEGREGSIPELKRFFLKDGAYQWLYIFKLGAEWKMPNLPVTLFGEAGVNSFYFTDINDGTANDGKAHSYSRINVYPYIKTSGFTFKLGVRIFSR
jgi:hypothetical protein